MKMIIDNDVPTGSTPEQEVAKLAKCNCCFSHKFNKPLMLKAWVELPYDHNANNPDKTISNRDANGVRKCMCSCRHTARFICRKFCIA